MLLFFILFGSFTSVTAVNSVSASELVENSWNTKTPMTKQAWARPGVVVFDGKIYVIGANVFYGDPFDPGYMECYDPKTDTWITLTPMPTPRCVGSVVVYQDQIFCIGGEVPNFGPVFVSRSVDVVEVYNPVNDEWSTKASLPVVDGPPLACVVNDQLFVITYSGETYVYDPSADSWVSKASLPFNALLSKVACVVNDQLFVAINKVIYDISENTWALVMYDSTTDSWIKKADPIVSEWPGAFRVVNDKIVMVDQPETNMNTGSAQLNIRIYDPTVDKWSEGKSGPKSMVFYGRLFVGVTSGVYASTKVYVFGYEQIDRNTFQAFTGVYDPINNAWSTAKAMSTPRHVSDQGTDNLIVVDDIFYLMGSGSFNEQYVPIDYLSDKQDTSKPDLTLNNIAIVALILIVIFAVVGVLVYLKKRSR
jgi:hypothetical protein